MKCILFGHRWVEHDGVGTYKGQTFWCCSECGKVSAMDPPVLSSSTFKARSDEMNGPTPDLPATTYMTGHR